MTFTHKFIRVQGSVTSQDNPPPEAKKVGFIPPLKKSRSGQLSPLWKSSDQDKMHPLREILRAERAKKRHFGAVLTWKFFQTRTIPPLERKYLMQSPPWHNFRSGQLSPLWHSVPCTRMLCMCLYKCIHCILIDYVRWWRYVFIFRRRKNASYNKHLGLGLAQDKYICKIQTSIRIFSSKKYIACILETIKYQTCNRVSITNIHFCKINF